MSRSRKSAIVRGKQIQEKAVIHEVASDAGSDLAEHLPTKNGRNRVQRTKRNTTSYTVEPEPLTKLEHARKSLVDATKAIRELMEDDDSQDTDNVQELQERLSLVANILRLKQCPAKSSRSGQTTSNVAEMDKSYLLRDAARGIIVLAPVEIIPCEYPYHPGKTVAYFRLKGKKMAQQYSISGYTPCAKAHRFVLDSKFWTEQVKAFGMFHEHIFRSDGWDLVHGRELGDGFASHAENQAMLAAAFLLLKKYTDEEPTRGKLWKLNRKLSKDGNLVKDIEILISDEPCDGCKGFKTFFEGYTGITFTLISWTNLAAIKKAKDGSGKRSFPKIDSEGFVQDDSTIYELKLKTMQIEMERLIKNNEYLRSEMETLSRVAHNLKAPNDHSDHEKSSSRVMVVIPSKPTTIAGLPQTPPKQTNTPAPVIVIAPKAPKKQVKAPSPVMTISRKRSHSQVDFDWTPRPGRKPRIETHSVRGRTPKSRAAHSEPMVQGYSPELLRELDMEEAQVYERVRVTNISERWMNAAAPRRK